MKLPGAGSMPVLGAVLRWELWSQPRRLLVTILAIEFLTAVGALDALFHERITGRALALGGVVVALSVAFEELSAGIERLRFRLTNGAFIDTTSVWMLSAAVVLPPGQAALVVVLLQVHAGARKRRSSGMKLYRVVLSSTALVLSTQAASLANAIVQHGDFATSGLVAACAVVIALITFAVVNLAVVLGVMWIAVRPERFSMLLGGWDDYAIEVASLSLGGLVSLALLHQPWLAILALPAMFTLQRSALVKQLEELASTDQKTGLLNAVAWQQVAQRELSRAQRESTFASILLIDLDHFKSVNDQHGHLVGDAALNAVGKALTQELRDYDTVGRFGGEEFVAVLPEAGASEARDIAERVRARIATMQISELAGGPDSSDHDALSASIGVAAYPAHGIEVEQLLHAADAALYAAKRGGRNRVEVASGGTQGDSAVEYTPAV